MQVGLILTIDTMVRVRVQGQGLFCEKQQQNTKNTNNSRHRRNKRFSQGDKKKTEVFKSLSPAFQEKKCS